MAYQNMKFASAEERDEEFRRRKAKGQKHMVRYSESGLFAFDDYGMVTESRSSYFIAWPQR